MPNADEKIAVVTRIDDSRPTTLDSAFQQTVGFEASNVTDAVLTPQQAIDFATEEASFGRIAVDERGLTPGMRLHVVEPVRKSLAEWRNARGPFDQMLAPQVDKIEALDRTAAEITEIHRRYEREETALERTIDADTNYQHVKARFVQAESRYKQKNAEHDQRSANLTAYKPYYYFALAFTAFAELLINYDVFERFLQVPAWAGATAVILGILLAFSAHGHGELLKQWTYRFGEDRTPAQRRGDWRLLALATIGLLIVLLAAGGSRYAAVMRLAQNTPAASLLGTEADIDISPVRDVLISLLGNVGAWLVGVFWSYVAHDVDPDYMEAAHEYSRTEKGYRKLRADVDKQRASLRAKCAKEVEKKEAAAKSYLRDFERPRALLLQLREHENGILVEAQAALTTSGRRYHDALIRQATERSSQLAFVAAVSGEPLSAYEYKNSGVKIDPEFVRSLC